MADSGHKMLRKSLVREKGETLNETLRKEKVIK
jgi:hypothetical protein